MKFNEYINIANKYSKENINKNCIIFEPLFRTENNMLYLSYMISDYNNNNEKEIIRPTHYILQNLYTGKIEKVYNCEEHDFTDQNTIPNNKIYNNSGSTVLYDIKNYIMKSLNNWKKQIKEEINNKFKKDLYNEKILLFNSKNISSKEYINENIDEIIKGIENDLYKHFEKDINNGIENYKNYLFNSIKTKYQNNIVDKKNIKIYTNLIKFLYPDFIELINIFTNIDNLIDTEYDIKLQNSIITINDLLNKIDKKIAELENDNN